MTKRMTNNKFIEYIKNKNGVKASEWAKRVLDHMGQKQQDYYITEVTKHNLNS